MTDPVDQVQRFEIPGKPVAKGRPRFARAGRFTRTFTPKETLAFEGLVAMSAEAAGVELLEGPVAIRITAIWPMKGAALKRSTRPSCWKSTKPDLDNVAKAVLDGLEGVAFRTDGQVAYLAVRKLHAAQGEPARTVVEIRTLRIEEVPQ